MAKEKLAIATVCQFLQVLLSMEKNLQNDAHELDKRNFKLYCRKYMECCIK